MVFYQLKIEVFFGTCNTFLEFNVKKSDEGFCNKKLIGEMRYF